MIKKVPTESFELFAEDALIGSVMLLLEVVNRIWGPSSAPHVPFDSTFVLSKTSEEIVLPNT